MSLDYDHFESWKDTNKQVMLAEDQDSLKPHSCHVIYVN